jgi:threonine aldolase
MREAMAKAEVGDDVFGEDPSVNRLQERAAALFEKDAALVVPTGTMANLTAVLAQTRPGDSVILHRDSHPFNYESGNLAMVAGVLTRTTGGQQGIMSPEDAAANIIQTDDPHFSPTTLIAIENTTNRGGGAVYPLETVTTIGRLARERGIRLHCDGARIFNAVVATGISPAEYAGPVDTISFCLSKALGCPAGSMVVGDAETIMRAHRYRKMLGGGMRQTGILAAAGLHALDHHVDRLKDDHSRLHRFREGLEGTPGLAFPLPSPTNILFIDVSDSAGFVERLKERNVLALATGPTRIRVVFHLDVTDEGMERAIKAFRAVAGLQ